MHPRQQNEFPVRIRIFWLLHRESFTRTLETTETRQPCISDLQERYKVQTVNFDFGQKPEIFTEATFLMLMNWSLIFG